jgi:hypothetical protein
LTTHRIRNVYVGKKSTMKSVEMLPCGGLHK